MNNDNQNKTKSISVTKTQQLTLPDMISNIKSIKGKFTASYPKFVFNFIIIIIYLNDKYLRKLFWTVVE